MNDDIKEILEWLDYGVYILSISKSPFKVPYKDMKKLLDYITNLQQELEEYKDTETYSKRFLYKANKDRLNANLELIQENEKLNQDLIYYQRYGADMLHKNNELEKRIEKAVEYIELNTEKTKVDNVRFPFELKELNLSTACRERLLNILNGRSDE